MNYRQMKIDDHEQVLALCARHNISVNLESTAWVAEHNGKIVGVVSARPIMEMTLVSENSIAAYRLNKIIESIIRTAAPFVRIICNPKLEKLYSKIGYKKVFNGDIIMEKTL